MTEFHFYHFLILCLLALLCWVLPKKVQIDGISLVSNLFLLIFSPIAFICLLLSSLAVYWVANYRRSKGIWILAVTTYCTLQFLLIREVQIILQNDYSYLISTLGIAYFTSRNIHYIFEIYKGTIRPNLRYFWYYQSFLPVLVTGPINRYQGFTREIERRHFSTQKFPIAFERIVYGYAQIIIIGNYVINEKLIYLLNNFIDSNTLFYQFLKSALDWGYLYMQFSGWSSVAIGFSLLMGIKIEENFNHPYKAVNIIDFWQRWHISLSQWCKDYVYIPLLAITRQPFYAITAAMLVMGVWHELSTYYLLWGIYHASGIAVCRVFQEQQNTYILMIRKMKLWSIIAWVMTMGFIISGTLVITAIDKVIC